MAAQPKAELDARLLPESDSAEVQAAATPIYGSFAEQMQRMQASHDNGGATMATPFFAHALAKAIIVFWQSGVASGSIDPTRPLYLMDLAPDQGQFAWLLLNTLRTKLTGDKRDWQVCFVACCTTENAANTLLSHPYLTDYVKDGWFDATLFDACDDGSPTLLQRSISLLHTDNPLVILSLGYFQTLPSELVAAYYGTLLQGTLALRPQADIPSTLDLDYQWSPVEPHAINDMLPLTLTDYYLKHFNSAPVLLPCVAAAVLQRLQILASGRYLLLAADPGICDEQAIRLGALIPPAQWDMKNAQNNTCLPVNYHALGLIQHQAGVWVWQRQIDDGGIVLHAAWRDDGGDSDKHCFDIITSHLDGAHPSQTEAVSHLIAATNTDDAMPLPTASILALLRQSQHDPALLKLALRGLLRQPPELSDCVRREWYSALARTWDNFMPLQQSDSFYYDIALFAMQIGYWGLAQDCLQLGLEWYGDDAHELYLLAWCEAATGSSPAALARLDRALALASDHAPAQALHAQLTEKLSCWQDHAWYLPHLAADAELSIEPLGQEHAASLLHPYRDEQISIMTRLPALHSVEQAQAWMAEEAQEVGRRSYAVMHACWGLVGIVSSNCAHDAGYFYFWIGSDYQRRGYGPRAAKLLFTQLMATGVSDIYTSVYKENLHSRHLMGKLGLVEMKIKTLPPDDAQSFYYLGAKLDEKKMLAHFLGLCEAIDCPIQMAE